MDNIFLVHADSSPPERFVSARKQSIPQAGYKELQHGDIMDTARVPLLCIPL